MGSLTVGRLSAPDLSDPDLSNPDLAKSDLPSTPDASGRPENPARVGELADALRQFHAKAGNSPAAGRVESPAQQSSRHLRMRAALLAAQQMNNRSVPLNIGAEAVLPSVQAALEEAGHIYAPAYDRLRHQPAQADALVQRAAQDVASLLLFQHVAFTEG